MKAVEYKVKHYYQPTNTSCGYASLAMLLSYYGSKDNPDTVIKKINIRNHGKVPGDSSITAQLAAWLAGQGYKVTFFSFDNQITDLSWADLNQNEILKRLEKAKDVRDVSAVCCKEWSKTYTQAYIDLIKKRRRTKNPAVCYEQALVWAAPSRPSVCKHLVYDVARQGQAKNDRASQKCS